MSRETAVRRLRESVGSQDQLDEGPLYGFVRITEAGICLFFFDESSEATLAVEKQAFVRECAAEERTVVA